MVVKKKTQMIIWFVWAILFSFSFWFAYNVAPPVEEFRTFDYIIFALLMISASLITIVVNGTALSFTQWASLVIFLKFGLLAEIIAGQLIVLIVMLRVRLTKEQGYKIALNSSMLLAISLLSAGVFYLFGGNHENYSIRDTEFILLSGLYLLSTFVFNQLILQTVYRVLFKSRRSIFSKDIKWEAISQLIAYPLGLILYFLYNSVGITSVLLIGIPVVSMLLIVNIYNESQEKNNYLQKAVEVGHLLTERLKADEVIEVFIQNLLELFPSDYLYVLDKTEEDWLELIRSYERGEYVKLDIPPMKKNEGIAGLAWATQKALLYREKKQWQSIVSGYIPEDAESLLVVPIVKNNDVTGVIFLGSSKKQIYDKFHLMIVDILSSYFAIALENARHYEKTKFQSERDSLTNLYNARVFNEKMEEFGEKFLNGELDTLSVLLIDVDHFKLVNDTYGHESGNKILFQLSELLRNLVGTKGILARYGGEEFAILMPNVSKEEALLFGEYIRETIENRPFVMYDDLSEVRRKLTVRITVSIGVASAPEDSDDPSSLIRYADRALYIGAKRVGRNKVANYVS